MIINSFKYFWFWVSFDRHELLSASSGYLIIKKIRLMYYTKGVYTEDYSWILLLFLIHIYYTSIILCVYWRRIFKTSALDLSLRFIFLSRWINSNKFELIQLHKNMKSTLALSINVMLKVTRFFYILNSNVKRKSLTLTLTL